MDDYIDDDKREDNDYLGLFMAIGAGVLGVAIVSILVLIILTLQML